jgi:hypothetical protein
MLLSGTVVAVRLDLAPFASDIPSAEALMPGVVTCKVAMLHESMLGVATGKLDLFVYTHRETLKSQMTVWCKLQPSVSILVVMKKQQRTL